jgi:Putative peptidoglycan binding domain
MSIATKKWASIALTVTTVLWAAGVASLPLANAQTTADLQAQIAALLAQIQQLQAQLGTSSSSTTTSSCYPFSSDLTVGSTGAQVTALQQILINGGYLTAVSAPTGYFGTLTQAAVGKWQAANGISPTAGYFGSISRAYYASHCVGTTTTTTTTGTGTTTTAPATGLSVSLASDNPGAGSLISGSNGGSGAARVEVLAANFTAGNSGAVTVTGINFTKTGVLSDSSISGAYLVQNGQVIAQYTSINNGVINFSGLNWQIPAGQSEEVQLAINVAGGLAAGNTTAFSLPAASDITAFDTNNNAVAPMGNFPLNGNTFTVTSVSNPSLATVTVSSTAIGTQVTAGTQGNLVGAWNFTVGNSKVYLDSLNFHVIGSANMSNLQNVKLVINGTQVGATLSSVSSNDIAYFNLSSNPAVLNTGSNNVQVFADVTGSPSDDFQFEILNGYDVYAVDSQYNVPISANSSDGTQIGIQQGQITVTQDSATPTGSIAKGQSQVTIAKFDIYAAGEAVRVQFLDFDIAFTGVSSGATIASQIKNVSLIDDAGGQVGSTINTPPSGNSCADSGNSVNVTNGAFTSTSGTYADCFGTASSPINYVVPANTTRVLSLKADVQSTASFSTIVGSLPGDSNNLQGITSSQSASSGSANGSSLTLANSSLTVAQNTAIGNQTVTAGVQNQEIGSYALSASSAEGVNVNNVSVVADGAYFSNLKLIVNGSQFGTTQPTVSSGTTYTFSGTPFNIPVGGTVDVNVYANTLSNATGTISPATILSSCSASGQISFSSITCSSLNGQNLHFGTGAALTLSAGSSQPPSGLVVMGSTGNPLASFLFTETSNNEPANITALTVTDSSTNPGAFSNLTLWNGGTQLGTAGPQTSVTTTGTAATTTLAIATPSGSATTTAQAAIYLTINGSAQQTVFVPAGDTATQAAAAIASSITSLKSTFQSTATNSGATIILASTLSGTSGNGGTATVNGVVGSQLAFSSNSATFAGGSNTVTTQTQISGGYTFNFAAPVQIPQGSSLALTLQGNAATYQSAGAVDDSTHQFVVTGSSGVTAVGATSNDTVSTTGSATGNTQTVLRTILTAAGTPVTSLPPASFQPIGTLTLTANSAGSALESKILLTFNVTSTAFLNSVVLKDPSGNDIVAVDNLATTSSVPSAGTVTWTFATSTNPLVITGGESYPLTLWANLGTIPSVSSQSQSLTATVQNATDLQYYDGSNSGSSLVSLPVTAVPITIANLTTPVGGQF